MLFCGILLLTLVANPPVSTTPVVNENLAKDMTVDRWCTLTCEFLKNTVKSPNFVTIFA
jgi:hypothetical protein